MSPEGDANKIMYINLFYAFLHHGVAEEAWVREVGHASVIQEDNESYTILSIL